MTLDDAEKLRCLNLLTLRPFVDLDSVLEVAPMFSDEKLMDEEMLVDDSSEVAVPFILKADKRRNVENTRVVALGDSPEEIRSALQAESEDGFFLSMSAPHSIKTVMFFGFRLHTLRSGQVYRCQITA